LSIGQVGGIVAEIDDAGRRTYELLDEELPVWVSFDLWSRLDNNFYHPAYFEAERTLKRLADSGRMEVHSFGELMSGDPRPGVATCEEGSIPILEGGNLRPNYVIPIFTKFAATDDPLNIQGGDILIGKDGEPGTAAAVTDELLEFIARSYERGTIASHVYRIRLREEFQSLAFYVVAYLNSRAGQAILRRYIAGGTTPTLRSGDVKAISVPVPQGGMVSVAEQARSNLVALQKSVLETSQHLAPSHALAEAVGLEDPSARLPINYVGGGRSDPHGYYRK